MTGFRFLGLPAELRNRIYEQLLSSKHVKHSDFTWYQFHLAILRCNHQLYLEAGGIWNKNIFVLIVTYSKDLVERIPLLMERPRVENLTNWHVRMWLDGSGSIVGTVRSLIIVADDLERFCKQFYFRTLDAQESRYVMNVGLGGTVDNSRSQVVLRSLLRPLNILYKFNINVNINGFRLDLGEDEISKFPGYFGPSTPFQRIREGVKYLSAGTTQLLASSPSSALEIYQKAREVLHLDTNSRLCAEHVSGFFNFCRSIAPYREQSGFYIHR